MTQRLDYTAIAPAGIKALGSVYGYIVQSGLPRPLVNLVYLRVSQINGCAYCLDMHWKDLQAEGEKEQRMYSLDAWRETPYYSDRERAALAWAEAVTNITDGHVPDEVYEQTRQHFSEQELADLTLAIAAINVWNRLSIAFRIVPGTYQPVQKLREERREQVGRSA